MLMKKLAVPLLSVSLVCGLAATSLAYGKTADNLANSDEQKLTKKRTSKQVPAMRNRVYSQLARAQKLADEGVKIAGFDVLDEVKERVNSLNSYERAMLWNFYAFMYYGNDDIDSAIEHF